MEAGNTPKPTGWLQCREMQDRHFLRNATATVVAAVVARGGQGWLEKGTENGDNHTIRDVRGVYRIFAFTQFSTRANASLAILRNRDLSSATRRDASQRGATQSSSGSVAVFNPGMLSACLRTVMKTLRITANICILRFHNIGKITTDECHPVSRYIFFDERKIE